MNVSIEQLAEQHGLTKYADDSYTCHDLYMTVEKDCTGDWTVWDIDNTVLFQGMFSECMEYITEQREQEARTNAAIDSAEKIEVAQTLITGVFASDEQYYDAKAVLLAKHLGWSALAISMLPLNY